MSIGLPITVIHFDFIFIEKKREISFRLFSILTAHAIVAIVYITTASTTVSIPNVFYLSLPLFDIVANWSLFRLIPRCCFVCRVVDSFGFIFLSLSTMDKSTPYDFVKKINERISKQTTAND